MKKATFSLMICLAAFFQAATCQVKIEQNGISIQPGTKISPADRSKMNSILQKYDASLYNVKTVTTGKVVASSGSLEGGKILRTGAITSTVVAGSGLSKVADACTLQITVCSGSNGTSAQNGTNATKTNSSMTGIAGAKQQQLLKELTPILSRYQF